MPVAPIHTAPRRPALRLTALLVAALAMALGLAACGTSDDTAGSDSPRSRGEISKEPLRVGVNPVPHGEILAFVRDGIAKKAGLNIEIVEYSDYVLPNTDLGAGKIDANFFQTPAYLDSQAKARKLDLVAVVGVHIEPLGLYSRRIKSLGAIPQGATVAIPRNATNVTRALKLLAAGGLIALKDEDDDDLSLEDVAENTKNLRFREVDAAQTPRALDTVDLAVINGNYALEAGLAPATDALVLEKADGNANVNLLVTVGKKRDDARIEKLGELLLSPEVKAFIDEKYKGAVIPAF